ncbi:Crp/Fnr family transcriptional regulator [Halobacillus sp. MO56]
MEDIVLPNFWIKNPPYYWGELKDAPSYEYKKNQIIFLEGTEMDTIYLVKKGKAKLFLTGPDGSEKIVGYVGENSILGTSSLFEESKKYILSAAAVTNSTLIKYERQEFIDQVMSNPDLMMQVFHIMSIRIRSLTGQSLDLSFKHSYIRLCKALLELGVKYGKQTECDTTFVDFKVTHNDLAELIGTTRVTIANHIKTLRGKQLVETKGRNFIIRMSELKAEINKN